MCEMSAETAHLESFWSSELRGYAAQLRARAVVILVITACLVAAAVAYLAVVPARYRASTEIFLDPRGLQVVQNDVTPRLETSEVATSLVESQSRIAQSEAVLRMVVDRLRLDADPEFVRPPNLLDRVRRSISPAREEDRQTRAMRTLQRAIDVHRASRSYVIVMSVLSEDPIKAARIVDAMANLYIEREVSARQNAAERVEQAMTSHLNELADRVRKSEDAVERFKAENNLIGSAARLMSDQQLEELNSRLSAEHANVVLLRARVEEIDKLLARGIDSDASLEAVQSPTIASLRAQYAQVVRRQASADALLGPRHPDTQVLREQRNGYRRLIAEELRRIADATRTEYNRALASEKTLQTDLEALKNVTIRSNGAMVRLRELERVAESNREIYRAFLTRAKEIGAQGGVDTSSTRIISAAVPPNRPSSPRGSLLLMAAFAGLILGIGYVLLSAPPARGRN
ncbi:MAG: GumC family protein [Hyphomicrobium sp.]|nr:MAG: GumC family protein [Hyphomicrobium sp.]